MVSCYSLEELKINTKSVVTIGTFDGVHLGHQQIIKLLVKNAKELGIPSVVLTFFPHPRMVLQQDSQIKMLQSLEEKAEKLKELGVDYLVIHPFTKEFSRMSAKDFVTQILVDGLKAKRLLIGYDHGFGRNRNANIEDLRKFGTTYNFDVTEISAKEINAIAVSSTKIRKAIALGDIEKANKYLGHCFSMSGIVGPGKQIGREIGFPTANINITFAHKTIPLKGVYVVKMNWQQSLVYGMLNIGENPTVSKNQEKPLEAAALKIEVHFFNFAEDLYNKNISVAFLHRLRAEEKFSSLAALKNQLGLDKKNALDYIDLL